jgi:hypothetical protein
MDGASRHPQCIEDVDLLRRLQEFLTEREEASAASMPTGARNRLSQKTALVRQGRIVARELQHGLAAADAALEAELMDGASRHPQCIEDVDLLRRLQEFLTERQESLENEFADGASRNPAFVEENLDGLCDVSENSKTHNARKDSSDYFLELEIDTNLRVCAVCSQEKSANEIPSKVYSENDEIFHILRLEGSLTPVLSIPSQLRWDMTVSNEENMRLQRYRLRVCQQCLRMLKKKRVPKESVRALPLNHFYGYRNGFRDLSVSTIEIHRELFRTMSPTTRSLLSLVRPVYTVITVRHYNNDIRQAVACVLVYFTG